MNNYKTMEQQHPKQREDNPRLHVVVIGTTGVGKSSTANTILGRDAFRADESSISLTNSSCDAKCSYNNKTITVVDTPGVNDNTQDDSAVKQELERIAFMLHGRVHCFIICLSAGEIRYTNQTDSMLKMIKLVYGKNVFNYCMVVYTRAELIEKSSTHKGFFNKQKKNEHYKRFFEMIDDRVVAVNNDSGIPTDDKEYRENIIAMVEQVETDNILHERPILYTNTTNRWFHKADLLHEKVDQIVTDNECHPILVNTVVEAAITQSTVKSKNNYDFSLHVVNILLKSKFCEFDHINGTYVFTNDDRKIVIDSCKIDDDIKLLYSEIAKAPVDGIHKKNKIFICVGISVILVIVSLTIILSIELAS